MKSTHFNGAYHPVERISPVQDERPGDLYHVYCDLGRFDFRSPNELDPNARYLAWINYSGSADFIGDDPDQPHEGQTVSPTLVSLLVVDREVKGLDHVQEE